MKYNKNRKASRQVLENLEHRQLLSSIVLNGTSLDLRGDAGQTNSFVIRAADGDRVLAFANNSGQTESLDLCQQIVVYLGADPGSVDVEGGVTTPVEVVCGNGQTFQLGAGQQQNFSASGGSSNNNGAPGTGGSGIGGTSGVGGTSSGGAASSGTGNSSSASGSSSTGSGASSSGSGSSSTGSGSSSTGSGASSSGSGSSSTGSGSTSTGSGASSTSSGSSSTGSGSSSTGSGTSSTGSGSSSTGSGSSSTGSGSSSTGSGSSSTGSGSSSTGSGSGSSGSGSGTTTPTPSNPNDPSTPHAVITVTSPSSVLPLESVNVQALNSTFGSGTVLTDEIAWNFGDPGSQYNTLVGFNAAHAYASPGTYTVTLTITTPDGFVGVATTVVTVEADNRPTIYVSPSGNDANNGSSPTEAIQSIDRLNQLLTSNVRVLFQDGGTYDLSDQNIELSGLQHVYLGSYGTGAQPILMDTAGSMASMIGLSASSEGIVIQGLTFNSIYTTDDTNQPDGADLVGNDISFLDNTLLNLCDGLNMNQLPTNVLVQGNSVPLTGTTNDALNGYFCWIQGSNIALIGNTVANTIDQAVIRAGGAGTTGTTDLLVAYNNFTKLSPAGQSYKNCITLNWGQYMYVYANETTNGPILVGPIGDDGVPAPDQSIQDVVIDSNNMSDDVINIAPEAIDTMVRNNVLHPDMSYGIYVDSTDVGNGLTWQVQNLWIENNTVDETSVDGGFLSIGGGESQGIVVEDNLYLNPNLVIGDNGSAYIYDSNNDLNSFSEIADNVWGAPAEIYQWNLNGVFFLGSDPSAESAWITPAQWQSETLGSGSSPTGDVYESVTLGSTYSVNANGFTAGSSLANS